MKIRKSIIERGRRISRIRSGRGREEKEPLSLASIPWIACLVRQKIDYPRLGLKALPSTGIEAFKLYGISLSTLRKRVLEAGRGPT